ncbi:MAG TPA: NnrS family protein [Caldimonas sp.]
MTLILRQEAPRTLLPPPRGFALWQLGFRPFYLLAAMLAAASILVWIGQLYGVFGFGYLPGPIWHAHEMLFGFALAVIVGFLFTAGRNWAGRPTPTGRWLAALAALWILGRCIALTPFGWAGAIASPAFALAAAASLAVPFWASRNRRNYFFIGLLAALGLLDLAIHLALLGAIELPPWLGVRLALDVVLFIMAVMAGRVIPMFTNNGVPGAGAVRQPALDRLALGSVLALTAFDLAFRSDVAIAAVALVAAALHAARWLLWRPWRTARNPLVWILHVAYAWIPLHLALRGLAALGWVADSAATHALTVGAVGGLVMGMMTRTSLGHTARPLRADRYDIACYAAVSIAALVRVFVPIAAPSQSPTAIVGSALLWSFAFALFAVRYWPVLTRPRLDGLPG